LAVEVFGQVLRVRDSSTNGTLVGSQFVQNGVVEATLDDAIFFGDYALRIVQVIDKNADSGRRSQLPPRGPQGRPTPTPVPMSNAKGKGPSGTGSARVPASAATTGEAGVGGVGGETGPAGTGVLSPKEDIVALLELRRELHKRLLEHMDLRTVNQGKTDDPALRPRVLQTLRRLVDQMGDRIPAHVDRAALVGELVDEAVGLGPLERFLRDASINEIMVIDPETIYVERGGRLTKTDARFTDDERVRAIIERIVTPLGRRIDESSPLVDARLKDGSRVNAVIRPLAIRGSAITIRKFARTPLTIHKLVHGGSLTEQMATFLERAVKAKKNIVISGGTGSGKTTLLNCLSAAIPDHERIVTIEDAAELQLKQPHVVSLETRPANMEGKGEYSIRDLVKNALRMRPDRIVVGECRGGEALDMLQAMNTGHDGSMTTTHANSPREGIARIETLVLMSGLDLPLRAIREQIASSVHIIVQQSRLGDGSRRVTSVTEVRGVDDDGQIELMPIFEFQRTGTGDKGEVLGEFRPTGYLPTMIDQFVKMGFIKPGDAFL
jgi:pilus assembly protein CpaF